MSAPGSPPHLPYDCLPVFWCHCVFQMFRIRHCIIVSNIMNAYVYIFKNCCFLLLNPFFCIQFSSYWRKAFRASLSKGLYLLDSGLFLVQNILRLPLAGYRLFRWLFFQRDGEAISLGDRILPLPKDVHVHILIPGTCACIFYDMGILQVWLGYWDQKMILTVQVDLVSSPGFQ